MFRISSIFLILIFSFIHGRLKDKHETKNNASKQSYKEQISIENVQIDEKENNNKVQLPKIF